MSRKKKKDPPKANRKCPLCGEEMLRGGLNYSQFYAMNVVYCPKTLRLPERSTPKHHYVEDLDLKEVTQYVLPYRIVTTIYKDQENTSKISIQSRYKTGKHYFKTILKCGAWPLCYSEKRLIQKIKTLMVFS